MMSITQFQLDGSHTRLVMNINTRPMKYNDIKSIKQSR